MAKLLVADDDSDLCAFLREELTDAGYQVITVKNGADAVVAAAEQSFDLAILDMLMPGLDGIQTIKVLRKIVPELAIIGLTGYVGRGYMAQTSVYGVVCLSKPVDIATLLKEISELLNQKEKKTKK